jgi:hypothetical protein
MRRSYRIVLEYTTDDMLTNHPDLWDWHDLVAQNANETVSVVNVETIETPAGHVEDLKEFDNNV